MIYHVLNGQVRHTSPSVIKIINAKFGSGQIKNKHFYCITRFGQKMLYKDPGDIYTDMMQELKIEEYRFFDEDDDLLKFLQNTREEDKIVFHSVQTTKFWMKYNCRCLFNKKLARKTSLICWGEADFTMGKTNFIKRLVRLMIGYTYSKFFAVVTLSIEDEKKLIQMFNGVNGYYMPYPTTSKRVLCTDKNNKSLNIMVSHSGWPHNNHLESFNLISRFADENIDIHCPLCYGDPEYISMVIKEGKRTFGEKFHYFTELKSIAEYIEWTKMIDVFINSANVQTGLGALYLTMSGGAKIYVKGNLLMSLRNEGYFIFDLEELINMSFKTLAEPMKIEEQQHNIDVFNEKHCDGKEIVEKWRNFFED